MTGRLLKTREVADYLGVSPETVLRRFRAGELPGIRLASNAVRFQESELEAWVDERRSICQDRPRAPIGPESSRVTLCAPSGAVGQSPSPGGFAHERGTS